MNLINFACDNCGEVDCEYLKKIKQAISEVDTTKDVDDLPVYINGGDNYLFYYGSYRGGDEINISCGALKVRTKDEICESLENFFNSEWITEHYGYVNDEGEEVDENDGEEGGNNENLSREEKIEKIREILKIENPIKIVESREVNGHINIDGDIFINSAALDTLDLDELAFMIAHEKGHINLGHAEKKLEILNKMEEAVRLTFKSNKSLMGKLADVAKIGIAGFAGSVALNQTSEIEADIEAKKMLREANYSEDGGEKTLSRYDNGFSLSHPSSKLRRRIIKDS